MPLILASSSLNRKSLFDRLGLRYQIIEPDYEEIINPNVSPEQQIQEFAVGKAKSVQKKFLDQTLAITDYLILGFDSMIEFEGKSIGKAKTKEDAIQMLQKFKGKTQHVTTGFSLIGRHEGKNFEITDYESTQVKFRNNITDEEIQKYVDFDDWQEKCGAYSILGPGHLLLESITGDFQNIVGVPVIKINRCLLQKTGKSLLLYNC